MSDTPYELFRQQFTLKSIRAAFNDEIAGSMTSGVDGLSAQQFRAQAEQHFKIIYRKCRDGTYKFAPYKQVLIPRGAERKPRQIAIPTVRDRIVLFLLKEVLQAIFPDATRSELPNTYIADLKSIFGPARSRDLVCYRTDIKGFFPSINRDVLFGLLQRRTQSAYLLTLISRALLAPIVPDQHNKRDRHLHSTEQGVPQGLAISNILADIYGAEVDDAVEDRCFFYRRYVDDILIFVDSSDLGRVKREVSASLARLDLSENKRKRSTVSLDEPFDYLGYRITRQGITVRDETVERHISKLAGLVTRFRRGGYNHIGGKSTRRTVFLEDLNERITGAVSAEKRYGWIFFFLEITDMELLHRIDATVAQLLGRLPPFSGARPNDLKRTVRAFYEAKYTPRSGYIHNYNEYGVKEKRQFLVARNHIEGSEDEETIHRIFERIKGRRLRSLKVDAATMS